MLQSTKFDFRWGSAADPARAAYSTPLDVLAVFKGLILWRRRVKKDGMGMAGRKGRRRRGGEELEGEREERGKGVCRTNVKLLPTCL